MSNYADPSLWKMLLVDDDEDNRQITSTILQYYNAQVTEAASGQDALALLQRISDFTFILLDIKMEFVSGFNVLDAIRSDGHEELRNIPVIAISALATRAEQDRIRKADFDGLIVKPYNPLTLVEDIAMLLPG